MAKKEVGKSGGKKDRSRTSGSVSSERRDDRTTKATKSVSKNAVRDVDFSSSPSGFGASGIDFSDAKPVSEFGPSSDRGLSFDGGGFSDTDDGDTKALTSALDSLQFENDFLGEELERVVFDAAELQRQNDMLRSGVDLLEGIVSAGGAPNPEMGGSAQRRSQSDLIESPEFDAFTDSVTGDPSFIDRIANFFSPVSTEPAVEQETGMFGFESKLHPQKFNLGLNVLSQITGIDPSIDLGFTSATDAAKRRRDGSETSGIRSSERQDEDRPQPKASEEKESSDNKDKEKKEESLIPEDFLDFSFRDIAPLLMPNFALLGNPEFIKRFQKDEDKNNG